MPFALAASPRKPLQSPIKDRKSETLNASVYFEGGWTDVDGFGGSQEEGVMTAAVPPDAGTEMVIKTIAFMVDESSNGGLRLV